MAPITAEDKFREMALKYGMGKYGLPKTGMTTVCLPGDDGSYQFGNYETDFRFTLSPIGELFDQATGLAWPINFVPVIETWQAAIDYCNNLNYAGMSGWRLPNIHELYSIINWGLMPVRPDPNYFKVEEYQIFWTSTTRAEETVSAFVIELYGGKMDFEVKSAVHYILPCRYSSLWKKRRGK